MFAYNFHLKKKTIFFTKSSLNNCVVDLVQGHTSKRWEIRKTDRKICYWNEAFSNLKHFLVIILVFFCCFIVLRSVSPHLILMRLSNTRKRCCETIFIVMKLLDWLFEREKEIFGCQSVEEIHFGLSFSLTMRPLHIFTLSFFISFNRSRCDNCKQKDLQFFFNSKSGL